jgi:hypothetical protein
MRGFWCFALLCVASTACTLLVVTTDLSGEGAGVPSDAQVEADTMVDAPRPVSCAEPSIVVCETFDDEAAVARYATSTDESTTVTSSAAMSASAPRSALFTIEPSSSTSPDATLTIRPTGALTDFAVQGVFYIARREPGKEARLLNVSPLGDAGVGEPIHLQQSGQVRNADAVTNVGEFAGGRWVSIRLEVRSSVQPAEARLAVDGVEALLALPAGWKPSEIFVRLGVSEANSPTTGWLVYWDDIVIRRL